MLWLLLPCITAIFVPVNQYNLTDRFILRDLSENIPFCERTVLEDVEYTFCSNNPERGNTDFCLSKQDPCTLEDLLSLLETHVMDISVTQKNDSSFEFPLIPFQNKLLFSPAALQEKINRAFLYNEVTFSTPSFTLWTSSAASFFFLMCFLEVDAYTTDIQKKYCCYASTDASNRNLFLDSVCIDLPGAVMTASSSEGFPVLRASSCSFETDMRTVCKTQQKLNEWNILEPVVGSAECYYACAWPCFTRFVHPDCHLQIGAAASYYCETSSLNRILRPLQCNDNIMEYWTDEHGNGCLHPQEIVVGENPISGEPCLPGEINCVHLRCTCPLNSGCALHPYCQERGTLFETSTAGNGICVCNSGFSGTFCEKELFQVKEQSFCHFSQHLPKNVYQYLP